MKCFYRTEEFGIEFAFSGPARGMSIKTAIMVIEETPEIETEPFLVFISKSQKDLATTEAVYSKLKLGNRIKTIRSIEELFSFMEVHQSFEWPSLVVIDVEKQKAEGAQLLNQWKLNEQYKHIPVLIYGTLNYQEEKDWLNIGASYCRKKRKTNEGTEKLLIEFISLADILHEINIGQH